MGLLAVDLTNRISDLQPLSKKALPANQRKGVSFPKYFTQKLEPGKTPYDEIAWELRTAAIASDKGAIIFEQDEVEVPAEWSQTATNIVVSKYFYGKMGSPERERSVRQLVHRVVDTIADWGAYGRYFKAREDAENFRNELAHLMLTQKACFNSPVWFNVGVSEPRGYGYYYDEATDGIVKMKKGDSRPQCSACFINSVKDSLESILDLAKTEGMLFKWGSGTGTNLSPLREEGGGLAGGGTASGPLSFMKGFDAFAGVIKSGGKTRRAAKMVILNVDHPDIEAFVWCKAKEEKKAHTLIDAGYDAAIDGDAYGSIFFQNANNSVRVTDEFMEAVAADGDWWTRSVANGQPKKRYSAKELLREIARRHASVRRSGHAVRHDHQSLAHFESHGAHQRVESVLGIYVPGRFGLQPGVLEPDEVCRPGRRIRCRGFPACLRYGDAGAGDYRRQRQLSDREDRQEFARFPPARFGLCQPGRAADVDGHSL